MNVIQTKNIRKEFGPVVAVNDVNLTVDKGQVLGLIGPNGAGKTTLLRILATVLRPTDGSATVLGNNLTTKYLLIRKEIGYMPDFFNLYNDLTLSQCLNFFANAYAVPKDSIPEKIDAVLKFVDLEQKRNNLIRHLSRGMVQRMGVAVLLVHDPQIFLLDEPASGLDPKARIQLRDVLRRLSAEGKTVVISSHILTELSGFCTNIAIMNEGKIVVSGAVDEIQQKVAGARVITVSVLNEPTKAESIIKDYPNARLISVDGNTLTLELNTPLEGLAELNAHLVSGGLKVIGFSEKKSDLEELFMAVSSEQQ